MRGALSVGFSDIGLPHVCNSGHRCSGIEGRSEYSAVYDDVAITSLILKQTPLPSARMGGKKISFKSVISETIGLLSYLATLFNWCTRRSYSNHIAIAGWVAAGCDALFLLTYWAHLFLQMSKCVSNDHKAPKGLLWVVDIADDLLGDIFTTAMSVVIAVSLAGDNKAPLLMTVMASFLKASVKVGTHVMKALKFYQAGGSVLRRPTDYVHVIE
jgi:hypothetical protein